jgi:Protein of unknown function (DUF3558)
MRSMAFPGEPPVADRGRRTWLTVTIALVGAATLSCTTVNGEPRPAEAALIPPAPDTAVAQPDDLDLCAVLTPEDFPFEPNRRFPTKKVIDPNGTCSWSAHKDENPLDGFLTGVSLLEMPFGEYRSPPTAVNKQRVVIAGRPALVETVFSAGVGTDCDAVFGTADRTIVVSLIDETENHPDPCQTVVELAKLVASRTPPPTE